MKITTIDAGFFKLDGGAMFGVVPKVLWQKLNPPDEDNLCTWALRCLLVDTGDRKILVDTGLGHKQSDKFFSHYKPHGEGDLMASLKKTGYSPEDITDVFLTHLHFDHCGGAVKKETGGTLTPTFPNAIYWSNKPHYEWAYTPNPRERASFLKENFVPLKEAGVLQFIQHEEGLVDWLPGLQVEFVDGHTEAMMLLHIDTGNRKLIYCADLLPSSFHIGLPYVMAYDVRPLDTLDEKEKFLNRAYENDSILIFEHDPKTECCTLKKDERGRIRLKEAFKLSELK